MSAAHCRMSMLLNQTVFKGKSVCCFVSVVYCFHAMLNLLCPSNVSGLQLFFFDRRPSNELNWLTLCNACACIDPWFTVNMFGVHSIICSILNYLIGVSFMVISIHWKHKCAHERDRGKQCDNVTTNQVTQKEEDKLFIDIVNGLLGGVTTAARQWNTMAGSQSLHRSIWM